ncbi:MAG TPA: hypothetical protein VFO77_02435 [Actinoplanes sp.]|nr:hypothetical protein [Actinoplanes sp.]
MTPVPPAPDEVRAPHRLAGTLDGRTGARLSLGSSAATVDVRLTELPGLLYRISTPGDSGLTPQVTAVAGVLRLRLAPTGDPGDDAVQILLNRRVTWQIRLGVGAGEQHLDLDRGRISSVVVGAGAGLVRLRLPRPRGTVPIRLAGPVGSAEIDAPVPVRVRVGEGAGDVRLPWLVRHAVSAGTVLTPPGWPRASDRYVLDARGQVGSLTVGTAR